MCYMLRLCTLGLICAILSLCWRHCQCYDCVQIESMAIIEVEWMMMLMMQRRATHPGSPWWWLVVLVVNQNNPRCCYARSYCWSAECAKTVSLELLHITSSDRPLLADFWHSLAVTISAKFAIKQTLLSTTHQTLRYTTTIGVGDGDGRGHVPPLPPPEIREQNFRAIFK